QVEPELGAGRERCTDRVVRLAVGWARGGGRAERGGILAEEDRDAVEAGADPDDLARGTELVELRGLIVRHAARQHLRLPERDGKRKSLQRHERFAQRRAAVDPVPGGKEASERFLFCRLHFAPERSERRAAEAAQDIGVAPFALAPSRTELSTHEPVVALEVVQLRFDIASEMVIRLSGRERTTAAREAQDEGEQRIVAALEEDFRQSAGGHH